MVIGRIIVMLLVLWNNINNWVWNNENEEVNKLCMQTFHILKDWFMAQNF